MNASQCLQFAAFAVMTFCLWFISETMICFLSPWNHSTFGITFTLVIFLARMAISLRCQRCTRTCHSAFLLCDISCIWQTILTTSFKLEEKFIQPFSHDTVSDWQTDVNLMPYIYAIHCLFELYRKFWIVLQKHL